MSRILMSTIYLQGSDTMYYELPHLDPEKILEYLRKSRSDDPLMSVEDVLKKHESILSEWTGRNIGQPIPENNIYREVVSGETIDDRPEMLKLLKRIESPQIKAILTVEVQRLSRGDLEDAGRLIKLLRYTNTLVITPSKTYNLQDEYDRDIFERELKRGNEFLEYQKRIMGRGRILSVKQGHYIGSVAPYGYDKVFVNEGKRKVPTLAINKSEGPVVTMIYDLYCSQYLGYSKIAKYLDQLCIKPRKAKHWTPAMIRDILCNPVYVGKVFWMRRRNINVIENGEVILTRPVSKDGDFILCDGIHPHIIDDSVFHAAQERTGKNARVTSAREQRNALAGLLYCDCGKAMSYRTYKKNGISKSAPRLLCDDQTYCGMASSLYNDVVNMVCDLLRQSINDFEIKIDNNSPDVVDFYQMQLHNLEERLTELKRKEINLWDKYSEEGMPKEIFDNLHEKVLSEKKEIEQNITTLRNTMPNPVYYKEKIQTFSEALEALSNPDVPASVQNTLLKACIDRITYKRDRAPRTSDGSWQNGNISLEVKLNI